jgi:DNA-directed RNA polymerase specialized sigma24 family protein/ribosome-associated translation inhibitor RaiA
MTTKKKALRHFPWSLECRRLEMPDGSLQKVLRRKITRLEKLLQHYPPEAVHLHIVMARSAATGRHSARLTLRLPRHILHRTKFAPEPVAAFVAALEALCLEISGRKQVKPRPAPALPGAKKIRRRRPSGFAAKPRTGAAAPAGLGDVLRDLLAHNYARLLQHVKLLLSHAGENGDRLDRIIDPRAVVDEIARRALADPERKPARISHLLWLYTLARQEVARRRRLLKAQTTDTVSLESLRKLPEIDEEEEGYDAEQPLDLIERQEATTRTSMRELTPDDHAVSPADSAVSHDLLEEARRVAGDWTKPEREIFELHYVDGFEPQEIATVTRRPLRRVQATIDVLHDRLQSALREPARA